jgi:hypothetical protein
MSDAALAAEQAAQGRRTLIEQPAAGRLPAEESDIPTMATVERPSPLRRFLRRLVASEAELDAEELQRSTAASGCTPACDVRRGQVVSVSGRLRTVVYTPRTNLPTLEADLYDGSDVVTLVWLGRRHIAGIEPGRALTARGRLAVRDDRKVIYNPYYELDAPR